MEKIIHLKTINPTELFGVGDSNLKLIESVIPAKIIIRDDKIKINGDDVDVAIVHEILLEMMETLNDKGSISIRDIKNLITLIKSDKNDLKNINGFKQDIIIHYGKKGGIFPKTKGQEDYLRLIQDNDIVFSIGPAGTGKTFLAVAFAIAALENNEVDRIILCRPAVEAGESLGFLPGDLKDKVDPYLAPLYDSLRLMISDSQMKQYIEQKKIEVVPLAYMRGRTLDNSYMILDEAQNTTPIQMKMFLTRLGIGSRAIVTGDVTQIDLKKDAYSGLVQAEKILNNVEGIGFVYLKSTDIVRHQLVMKIINAYEIKN
tara:strand:+ start:1092 stop:2039 length:948 start_codon:yes stop_codon:yes gene_type:complete